MSRLSTKQRRSRRRRREDYQAAKGYALMMSMPGLPRVLDAMTFLYRFPFRASRPAPGPERTTP